MSDERFARQYRFELPSGFLLTSPCTSIVHHLSGPSISALARRLAKRLVALPAMRPFYEAQAISISLRIGVCHPNTRTHVRLLGPCFKTGRTTPDNVTILARSTPGGVGNGEASARGPLGCHRARRQVIAPADGARVDRGTGVLARSGVRSSRVVRLLPTISRTISLSFQSSFHLSLTVLVRYRSLANI